MVQFQNPIVGGTQLIREAIQSDNYQPGESGWTINQDGTAEFSDLTIHSSDGTTSTITEENGVITIRDGNGNIVVTISSAGVQVFSSDGVVFALLNSGQLQFGTTGVSTTQPTTIFGNDNEYQLQLQSGSPGVGVGQSKILLEDGGGIIGSGNPIITLSASGNSTDPLVINLDGVVQSNSSAFGAINITPTAANTPTQMTVSGLNLAGSAAYGLATADTSVPGTQVTGVGVNAVSTSGMNVWLTRTNTTTTTVFWMVNSVL